MPFLPLFGESSFSPSDPFTIDKPYLALRVATHDGDLVFAVKDGFCDGIELNVPYIGLRAATHDGKLVYIISDQKLEADGTLTMDKPYIGLRVATHDGSLVYVIDGKECAPSEPVICDGCEICCTLDATVQLTVYGDDETYDDPVDLTLTCGAAFTRWYGVWCCVDDETEEPFCENAGFVTYTGRDGVFDWDFGAPYGVVPVTIKSDVWLSEEFTYQNIMMPFPGDTQARLVYAAANFSYTTDMLHEDCFQIVYLQHKLTPYFYGEWTTRCQAQSSTASGVNPFAGAEWWENLDFLFEVSLPLDLECDEGFTFIRTGDNGDVYNCSTIGPGGGWGDCPIFIDFEVNPPGDEKCCKVQIMDNCE